MSINRITTKENSIICDNLYIDNEFNIDIENANISQVYKNENDIVGWYDKQEINLNGVEFLYAELIFENFTFSPYINDEQLIPFSNIPVISTNFFNIDDGILEITEDGVYIFSCSIGIDTTSTNQCANMRLRRSDINNTGLYNEGNAMSYTSIVPVYNLVETSRHTMYGEWSVVISNQTRNRFAMYGSSTNTSSINLIQNNCSFDIVKIS